MLCIEHSQYELTKGEMYPLEPISWNIFCLKGQRVLLKWHSLWFMSVHNHQQIFIKHLLCTIDSSLHCRYSRKHNRTKYLLSWRRLCRDTQTSKGNFTMNEMGKHLRVWKKSNRTWFNVSKGSSTVWKINRSKGARRETS